MTESLAAKWSFKNEFGQVITPNIEIDYSAMENVVVAESSTWSLPVTPYWRRPDHGTSRVQSRLCLPMRIQPSRMTSVEYSYGSRFTYPGDWICTADDATKKSTDEIISELTYIGHETARPETVIDHSRICRLCRRWQLA
ncbi:MAG: hypothetical protein MZU97_09840 [Bacillus subtilis]|nr:hypothetical protein [Bacillus subtilis]